MWEVPFLLRIPDDVHSAFVQLGADEPSVQPLIGGAEAIPRDKEEWHDGQDRQHITKNEVLCTQGCRIQSLQECAFPILCHQCCGKEGHEGKAEDRDARRERIDLKHIYRNILLHGAQQKQQHQGGSKVSSKPSSKELLPTTSGFFFGSTDYDEYYYEDIEYTANKIREILETTDFETQMIYYISSW